MTDSHPSLRDERRGEYYAGIKPEEMGDMQALLDILGDPRNLAMLVMRAREIQAHGRGKLTLFFSGGCLVGQEAAPWDGFYRE